MTDASNGDRKIIWLHVLTVVSAAILIGAEDLRPHLPISVEHLGNRVAEVIRPAGADDRNPGRERSHQFRRARCEAPVMRNLDDPD